MIDNEELWQIGGSVNSKNINSTTLTKIFDKETRDKILKELNELWEKL